MEDKFNDKRYRARVMDWIRKLRHEDGRAARESRLRDGMRGNLSTGGKMGFSPGVPPALWEGKVRTDNVDLTQLPEET